jgi:hypothetical protein
MKFLGVALLLIGIGAFFVPFIITSSHGDAGNLSPLLGITALAIGGSILLASVICKK